jgi:hypothetical protein
MHQSKSPKPKPASSGAADSLYPVYPKFEYHVMRIQDTAPRLPTFELDDLGKVGWEMVSIFRLHATINFVFKRRMFRPGVEASKAVPLPDQKETE